LKRRIDLFYHANLAHIQMDSGCEFDLERCDPQLAVQSAYLRRVTGFPAWQGTAGEFFPLGDVTFPRMIEELKRAERFILLEYFIISPGIMWEEMLAVLRERRAAGVEIRIMYDDIGTISTLPTGYDRTLRAMGFDVVVFNPYEPHLNMSMNYRDHRKICVIDGNVGFCGGINIADEYINRLPRFGHWKDTAVMLKGEGVWNLTLMFLTLWGFSSPGSRIDYARYIPTVACRSEGFVQPFGDSPLDRLSVSETVYLQMIHRAVDYLYLTTPYRVLDNETIVARPTAAQRGVDVRVITPHIPDKWYVHLVSRSYYRALLHGGVRIFEYQPGFIHAKQMVSDDKIAVVGTANFDFRSLYLHFECGVLFYHSPVVTQVRDDIVQTLSVCQEISPEAAGSLKLWERALAAVLRVIAPLI
ncbi:MAG: phospholipase D-like domain-containing protein, partial [Oscillospiraceae bacterium]